MSKRRVAVLISGRGSNMQSLVRAAAFSDYPAEISLVLSNKTDAPGLIWAAEHGVSTAIIDHRDFADRASFEDALVAVFTEHRIDIVCLAGFMRVLSLHFFQNWTKPVLNIHPSLLPKHKGLNTHEAALAAGDTEHGCSVHLVNEELDGGAVILQRRVPVRPGDTPDDLAARVLIEEHIAYPQALKMIATGAN